MEYCCNLCFLFPLHSPETFEEARRREKKYSSTMCATTDLETEDEEAAREKRKPR